jgi:hypothetical protein
VPEFREPQLGPVREQSQQGGLYEFTINVEYSLTPPSRRPAEDPAEAPAAAG